MTLNEYQEQAMTTCLPTSNNFSYMFLNLVGETGEFSSKVAKQIRKGNIVIDDNKFVCIHDSAIVRHSLETELQLEAGDILWQLTCLAKTFGWDLEDIAQKNLDKLAARKAVNTIDGSGDGITPEERNK